MTALINKRSIELRERQASRLFSPRFAVRRVFFSLVGVSGSQEGANSMESAFFIWMLLFEMSICFADFSSFLPNV